jgi:ketosteroid isomerase-like protein
VSEQDNVQQAKDAYAAFGRGDIAGVMRDMSDDVEWIIPGPADLPNAGTFRGKQAVQTWFGGLAQTLDFKRFEPYEFIAQGDRVVVLIRQEATVRQNNRTVKDELAQVLTYRNGKLARFQSFYDTAASLAAFRGE